jgi:ABC-type multidrug transport system fused ATPase/permease subunit
MKRKNQKEKKEKLSFKKTLSNNLFALKAIWQGSPSYLIIYLGSSFVYGILGFLSGNYLLQKIVNTTTSGGSIDSIIDYTIVLSVVCLVCYTALHWYWNVGSLPATRNIAAGIEKRLFRKAAKVELACYETPSFYDKYVRAMDEAYNRMINVMNSLDRLIHKMISLGANSLLLFIIDPWLILFGLFPLVLGYFRRLENRLFSDSFTDEEYGYRQLFDIESFLKHFIVGEISGNTDTYWSTYMYKERGDDKIYTGPVWDFDIAFENDHRTHPINSYDDFIYATDVSSAAGGDDMKRFVSRIVKEDPVANAQLKEIWNELRSNGTLSEESLIAYIDQTAELLDESQRLNFKRWNILSKKFHMNFQALGTYEAEVGTVRSYINERLKRLDQIINR